MHLTTVKAHRHFSKYQQKGITTMPTKTFIFYTSVVGLSFDPTGSCDFDFIYLLLLVHTTNQLHQTHMHTIFAGASPVLLLQIIYFFLF